MAKRPFPPDDVGMNERIGRRFFNEPMLRGAEGQPSFSGIELHHFEDSRSREISLDRLGATGLDKRVVQYLRPRAEAAGGARLKPIRFEGWLHVSAKELAEARKPPRHPVIASPVKDPEPDDNRYHAHVVRPEAMSDHLMSLQLRYIFTKYGGVERNDGADAPTKRWWGRLIAWISVPIARLRQNR
jgi:hypothetical protein